MSLTPRSTNFGKTFAIHHALNYAPDGNIFLCDSDLKNLDNEEISNAIIKFDLLDLDMLILRRIKISFLPKIIRSDTLLSGERILRKIDLKNIVGMFINTKQELYLFSLILTFCLDFSHPSMECNSMVSLAALGSNPG